MKNIIIDTNLLLDDPKIIYKLSAKYEKVIVPLTVLKELDKHKFNKDLSFSARAAIRELVTFKESFPEKIILSMNDNELNGPDLLIIDSAIKNEADIATKDISMSVIAEAKGVETTLYSAVVNGLCNPYTYLDIADVPSGFFYPMTIDGGDYEEFLIWLNLNRDHWFFVIMRDGDRDVYLYANNPKTHKIHRLDNDEDYREIYVGNTKLKALDFYQTCAFYIMAEADHCLITGKWGSGKSLITTASALSRTHNKVFLSRPPVGINSRYDIGFLPGSKEDKMEQWFAGIISSLYFLYANTRSQTIGKDSGNCKYDMVKDKYFKEQFEMVPINAVQGMSLLEDDIMIIDEVQLIDIDYLSMILSRANEGSKLILLGDLAQTYSVVRPSESGLLKLLRLLPNKALAYVDLKVSYRSDLIELADLLQDKTIA